MKYLYIAVAGLLLACASEEQPAEIALFNGEDLSGWHLYNEEKTPSIWSVEEGLLTCDPSNDGAFGDLVTDLTYEGDYIFQCSWRVDSAATAVFSFMY